MPRPYTYVSIDTAQNERFGIYGIFEREPWTGTTLKNLPATVFCPTYPWFFKTCICFATIKQADQILVVSEGKIAEAGTHAELVKKDGIYKRFTEIRERAEGWKIDA